MISDALPRVRSVGVSNGKVLALSAGSMRRPPSSNLFSHRSRYGYKMDVFPRLKFRVGAEGHPGYKSLYEVYNSDIVQTLTKACRLEDLSFCLFAWVHLLWFTQGN